MDKTTSVHSALQDGMLSDFESERHDSEPRIVVTFRLARKVHDQMKIICQGNGTSISSFLRACCEGTIRDYGGKTE